MEIFQHRITEAMKDQIFRKALLKNWVGDEGANFVMGAHTGTPELLDFGMNLQTGRISRPRAGVALDHVSRCVAKAGRIIGIAGGTLPRRTSNSLRLNRVPTPWAKAVADQMGVEGAASAAA